MHYNPAYSEESDEKLVSKDLKPRPLDPSKNLLPSREDFESCICVVLYDSRSQNCIWSPIVVEDIIFAGWPLQFGSPFVDRAFPIIENQTSSHPR